MPNDRPFSVLVGFSDGTSLMVRKNVNEEAALKSYKEHTKGIGAMVGTTKQVTILYRDENSEDSEYQKVERWVYKPGVK